MAKSFQQAEAQAAPVAEAPKAAVAPPVAVLKPWLVTFNGKVERIEAANERDAWAICCDAHKMWPSPKSGKVEPA